MRQRGFTLVEVMVVLMIVGILLSMVNLSASDRAAQDETKQLADRITVAFGQYREEAVFQNLDLGVGWLPEEFILLGFYDLRLKSVAQDLETEELTLLQKNPWQGIDVNVGQSIAIPAEVQITLSIDEEEIDPSELFDEDTGPEPALLFLSSDEYTPFTIILTHDADPDFIITLTGDGVGPVRQKMERTDA
jgi:general secretion pathway protein H